MEKWKGRGGLFFSVIHELTRIFTNVFRQDSQDWQDFLTKRRKRSRLTARCRAASALRAQPSACRIASSSLSDPIVSDTLASARKSHCHANTKTALRALPMHERALRDCRAHVCHPPHSARREATPPCSSRPILHASLSPHVPPVAEVPHVTSTSHQNAPRQRLAGGAEGQVQAC